MFSVRRTFHSVVGELIRGLEDGTVVLDSLTQDEALKMLKGGARGISDWNYLRLNGEAVPSLASLELGGADLRGVNLSMVDLSGADLRGAMLRVADLGGATLCDAMLEGADLTEAILIRANLTHADLRRAKLNAVNFLGARLDGANLSNTDPRGANFLGAHLARAILEDSDLSGANLCGAKLHSARLANSNLFFTNLGRADLRDTDFTKAVCWKTIFAGVDLSTARGLETIVHKGASVIGLDTLALSKGRIPTPFLKAAYQSMDEAFVEEFLTLIENWDPVPVNVGAEEQFAFNELLVIH